MVLPFSSRSSSEVVTLVLSESSLSTVTGATTEVMASSSDCGPVMVTSDGTGLER